MASPLGPHHFGSEQYVNFLLIAKSRIQRGTRSTVPMDVVRWLTSRRRGFVNFPLLADVLGSGE
jgi:hypothetical protein